MSEANNESIKAKFIQLQSLLSAGSLGPQISQYLTQLAAFLNSSSHAEPSAPKQQAYAELRDTVKQVLYYLGKVKPCPSPIQSLIKDILIAICRFCSQYYLAHMPHGCGIMIREFLTSDCRLFIYDFAAAAPSEQEERVKEEEQKSWKWARPSSYKSVFFGTCVESIMSGIEKMHLKFEEMPLGVMAEFLKLLYYMDDYLQADIMTPLAVEYLSIQEELFKNPSKATLKEVSKEVLEEIVDHMNKLLRLHKDSSVHQRVGLLGVELGMAMLKMTSIEKRMTGCKVISKFSYQMLYRTSADLSEVNYCKWLLSQGFFQMTFEDHSQTTLIKASQETFKLFVKKGMVTKPMYQKFFNILEKGDADLRRSMFRLIDPFRIDYHQIQAIIEIFTELRPQEFYDEEFFYFLQGLARYATETQLKLLLQLTQNIIAEYYSKIESYMTKRRAVECYAYIFEKIIVYKEVDQRSEAYKEVVASFIESPSENKVILLRTLFNSLSQGKVDSFYQGKMAIDIVQTLPFMSTMLQLAVNEVYKGDLFYFVKNILNKYKKTYEYKPFSRDLILQAVQFPQIFELMIEFTPPLDLHSVMEELASLTKVKEFKFECFKHVFTRVNHQKLRPIKKQYADVIITEVTVDNPADFIGIETLKYLIFNSDREEVRRGASQLLVDVYTNIADDFREEGQIYLVDWMKSIVLLVRHKLKEFCQGGEDSSEKGVLGTLELVQQLLLNTEYFGVGSLSAHNSQIPTSTTYLKIYNNSTYGDDVLKVFEKKFSSNTTLFEVITQVSKLFKIGPLDVALEYPDRDFIRHNGLTLEELQLNMVELNAIKLPQSRCKKEALLVDGQLSEKAVAAFTHMFNRFAKDGFMTNVECASYIEGVTFGFCPLYDVRITQFFTKYDSDKDDKLTLQDFLNFYKDCVLDPQRLQTVEKNLANLRYRRDLQPYDADLATLSEQLLFRHHIWEHQEIYDHLFKLSHSSNGLIASLSQNLLLRLPTYPKVVNSLTDTVDLKGKNSFEVEYLLTALQIHLTKDKSAPAAFIEKENHISIFQHLSLMSQSEKRTPTDQKCLVICLHTLRSLLGQFNLRDSEQTCVPALNYKLPSTDVFLKLISEGINKGNSALLEPSFALQLTQEQLPLATVAEAAFNKDKQTRLLTCNFLYLGLISKQSHALDFFNMHVPPYHNQEWFTLLTRIIRLNIDLDTEAIFRRNLQVLSGLGQSLEGSRHNQLINGSLKLIHQLYPRLNDLCKTDLNQALGALLLRLLSDQNRELVYSLRIIESPEALLSDLSEGVDVMMSRESQPRNKFVGIRNLGCICYMNSILQQLFMLPKFRNLALGLEASRQQSTVEGLELVDDFLAQLQRMYVHLRWSQKQYYQPTTFCRAIKDPQGKPINTNIQEDAHEFINTCLDKMQKYCRDQTRLSTFEELFAGKTVTQIVCQTCQNKNEVLEQFYHLSLEVKGQHSLKESFEKFIQPEYISDYYCAHCDKKVDKITKQTLLKECPEVLIINLQRIIFDLESFLKVKVHTKLQFGQSLDLFNYVSSGAKPQNYNLKGVVIHSGTSEGGHYYSLIKQYGKWYKFNDQSVTPFNEGDIGREAFGGEDFTDSWGELSSSTNAYILFYQKQSLEKEQVEEVKIQTTLYDNVIEGNKAFLKQLQFNQPSFFIALDKLTRAVITAKLTQHYEKLLQIHLRVMGHLVINSDIKIQLIATAKDNLISLIDQMPLISSTLLEQILDSSIIYNYQEVICSHNDSNIRDLFSKTITKLASILLAEQQSEVPPLVKRLIDDLILLLSSDLFMKNMHKSYQFFELWRSLAWLPTVKQILMQRDCLAIFLDLLMGRDSPLCQDKKRNQLHSSQALPLVPVVTSLIEFKKNQLGFAPLEPPNGQLHPLTADEVRFVEQGLFYRKMMKNKLDIGLLAPIVRLVCFKDEKMSRVLAEVLVKALNSNDQIEDKTVVFANIKAYLKIDDHLKEERMEWVLGVPQLDSIRYEQHEFGMMTSSESKVMSYVSTCLFIKEEKYMPFLSTLFDKRKYFNSFSANGVLMLLELILEDEAVLRYIYRLPAPTYLHLTYLDWIEKYGMRVKLEEHYSLPIDRKVLASTIQQHLQKIKKKADELNLLQDLPANPLIIGKNSLMCHKESVKQNSYSIELIVHQTYVLPNKPYGMGNFSLPDEEFSFNSTLDPVTAQFFLKGNEASFDEPEGLQKKDSVITFEIKAEVGLLVKVQVQKFRHTLYLRSGNHSFNCPFAEGRISDLLQIEQHATEAVVEKEPAPSAGAGVGADVEVDNSYMGGSVSSYYMEMNCPTCTYLNVGREMCEMCGSALYP